MNDRPVPKMRNPGTAFLIGIGTTALFWVVSAAVASFLLHEEPFIDALFTHHTLSSLIVFAVILFAFLFSAGRIIAARDRAARAVAEPIAAAREASERSLRESEARYRDLFENANDLIQSVAPDGRFLYVNRAWRETLGYTAEEIAGLTFVDVIHPDSREHCSGMFGRLLSGENIGRVEAVFRSRNGTDVIVEGNVNCSIVNGSCVATRGIFRDVTQQRRAEEFVKNMLESLDEGFVVIGPDMTIRAANRSFIEKYAEQKGDVVGRHCYAVSHGLTRPCGEAGEQCAVEHAFRTGEPQSVVHVHRDRLNNHLDIEIKALPLRDALGRVTSVIEIYHDITEKKKLEDQLRHAQKMEAVGTLAGGIAHDFNNILTAVIGYGTLLRMKLAENGPLRAYVDQILLSTERAADLTQGLLAFSRKQPITLKSIELNTLVHNVQKLVRRLIGEDIEVRIETAGRPLPVRADSGQMEQVVMNLVTNARDATPRGGVLTIATGAAEWDAHDVQKRGYGAAGSYAALAISDTGAGIPEQVRERMFEPYFTTKEAGKGTGLGLSIVYGIVKQHEGFIEVASEPDKGSVFTIWLPLTKEAENAASAAEPQDLPGGENTILVGEDDEGVRRLVRSVLEGVGYKVIEAVNGEDVLRKFTEHRDDIDLVFLDIIMPRQNGGDAFRKIKDLRPDMRVLFASGYPSETLYAKGLVEDTYPVLAKPVSPRRLLQEVRAILDNGKADSPGRMRS